MGASTLFHLTNHLKRKQEEDKSHRKESNDAREPGAGVPDLALDWGMGDDELVRGGKKDKIEDLSYIEKKKLKRECFYSYVPIVMGQCNTIQITI